MNTIVQLNAPILKHGAIVIREPIMDDAQKLVRMWSKALGAEGVLTEGCDPYPDPSLFHVEAMRDNIVDPARQIVLAESPQGILGAMIIDWLSPYHCEHNCMAVTPEGRDLKIGSLLVEGALKLQQQRQLVINCTELVTHSLASQSAHFHHGFQAICGVGYAHYPKVFSPQHRESVLWTWQLLGTSARKTSEYNSHPILKQFCEREIFVPNEYKSIVSNISAQIRSLIRYEFGLVPQRPSRPPEIKADRKEGQAHYYIDVLSCGDIQSLSGKLNDILEDATALAKAFVLVRLNCNDPGCPEAASWLRERGFVFHSFLPCYRFDERGQTLTDLLCLQWVAPDVVRSNPLPGKSNSRIQLYGYPINITGELVNTIRRDFGRKGNVQAQ